jgi:hypothetical protein
MAPLQDKVEGYLEIGLNDNFEVVMNLDHDRNGVGHIVFSANQARHLAKLLLKNARAIDRQRRLEVKNDPHAR